LCTGSEGSAASGETGIASAHDDRTFPGFYPVIGIHPDQNEKVEVMVTVVNVEADNRHACDGLAHHGNH
jgi:hypothetical protein